MKRFALTAALLGTLIAVSATPASARYYYRRPVARAAARVVLPPYGVGVYGPRVYAPGYYGYRPYYGPSWGYYGYGRGWGPGYYGGYYGPAWGYRPGAYVGIGVY